MRSFNRDGRPWVITDAQAVQFSVECLAFYVYFIERMAFQILASADFQIFLKELRATAGETGGRNCRRRNFIVGDVLNPRIVKDFLPIV